MKQIYLIFLFLNFCLSCNCDKTNKIIDSGIVVKAALKGCYKLPQNENSLLFIDDSTYYFIVDVKLINTTDHSIQFLAYTCTTVGNIVLNTKLVRTDFNNCVNNSVTAIELKPKQEFSLPIILQTEKGNAFSSLKIGWIFLVPKPMDLFDDPRIIDRCRRNLENVIWSEPLDLYPASGYFYEIR